MFKLLIRLARFDVCFLGTASTMDGSRSWSDCQIETDSPVAVGAGGGARAVGIERRSEGTRKASNDGRATGRDTDARERDMARGVNLSWRRGVGRVRESKARLRRSRVVRAQGAAAGVGV